MPIIRKRLQPSDVYPDDIRYQPAGDKVERFIDGEWKESPESDPRKQTTLPPRVTADTRCDAAQSVADALENQITAINTAIDNAQTVATIAGLILGLFSFGVFAIFINIALAIAGYMLDLGTAAINAALPPTAFDTLACILYCHMDNNGRLKKDHLPLVYDDLAAQIGGVGSGVLISFLQLAGEGGINNLAAVGSSTGDCSGCDCDDSWCYLFEFDVVGAADWQKSTTDGFFNGVVTFGTGWVATDAVNIVQNPDTGNRAVYIARTFSLSTIKKVIMTYTFTAGTYDLNTWDAIFIALNGSRVIGISRALIVNGTNLTLTWEGTQTNISKIESFLRSSRDNSSPYGYTGSASIRSIRVEGVGINPFGEDNCP